MTNPIDPDAFPYGKVLVVGPMLSGLPLAPRLGELFEVLEFLGVKEPLALSIPFPELSLRRRNKICLISLPTIGLFQSGPQPARACYRAGRFAFVQLVAALLFLSVAKKCRVVILFHSEAIVIATLARILGKKSVYYIGGSGLMSMLARSGESRVEVLLAHLLGRLQNLIASIATILVATSWCTIREARLDKFTSKVRICPPFVDSEKFTVSRPYENRDLVVGYVGRLEAEKGVEQFLQAAKLTLSARGDVRFLIVGDGSLRQELRRGIHDERIAFRGLVSHAAVASYLNELALLVVPSFTEGIPRVVLEAMSCGTPVLATDVGGIREVIKDGRTGFLLGTNNPELIATKVLFLARNHSLLRSISVESRKLAEDSFTFQAMATSWGRVLHEVSEMRT